MPPEEDRSQSLGRVDHALLDYLTTPARQAGTLRETEHRPWPLPQRSWLQAQTWERLLFAHWRVPHDELRPLVPAQVPLDTFDGSAWLGITPFRVSGLRVRGLLPVPRLSAFLELNVRTYATLDDRPGIWFCSLDAESPLAVEAARRTYRLPYFHARMSWASEGVWTRYSSVRRDRASRPHAFRGRYRPTGAAARAQPGTLEHFLTERYCLYTVHEGRINRADIHHPPWPLQGAEADVEENTMAPDGLALPDEPPLLHYAERQDVVIWPLELLAGSGADRPAPGSDGA